MKTSHILLASVLVITGTSFGILTVFELPGSIMQWIISDVVLGMMLYISYFIIALQYDHSHGNFSTELPSGLA
ncbi:MAG: C4-dicarboxylate ABC transporter [Nitrosomonas sp.]|nr:C4-dicarboxylate ABC transporter [Nitrosomonas sp.]